MMSLEIVACVGHTRGYGALRHRKIQVFAPGFGILMMLCPGVVDNAPERLVGGERGEGGVIKAE